MGCAIVRMSLDVRSSLMRLPFRRPAAPATGRQNNVRGMSMLATSAFTVSLMNGGIRYMAAGMHPFEIAFFRCLFALLLLSPGFLRGSAGSLRTTKIWLHVLRSALNAVSMLCFFVALSLEPLAKIAALSFTTPLFATIGAVFLLGETMGRRWISLLVGLAGALLILRPGFEAITVGQMLVLTSSVIWATALIVIKVMARTESSVTMATYAMLFLTPMNLIAALFFWQWPSWEQLAWLAGLAAMGTVAQVSLGQAFRDADATLVMPLDYTRLIWAALIGYFFFAEVPQIWTWIGGTAIFLAVIYNAYHERRGRRVAAAAQESSPGARP